MSISSSFVYGFGFICECSDEKIRDFIENHKESFCKSDAECELFSRMREYDLDTLFAEYYCECSYVEGKYAVISNIMSRETGINFSFQPEEEEIGTPPAIILLENYPWRFNEIELKLSEMSLYEICMIYIKELDIEYRPDHLSLEYFV